MGIPARVSHSETAIKWGNEVSLRKNLASVGARVLVLKSPSYHDDDDDDDEDEDESAFSQ